MTIVYCLLSGDIFESIDTVAPTTVAELRAKLTHVLEDWNSNKKDVIRRHFNSIPVSENLSPNFKTLKFIVV